MTDAASYRDDDSPAVWLSRGAFVLALVLTTARAILPQYLRDVVPVAPLGPGEVMSPQPAGVATGVVLDTLCLLAALLVLGRLAIDRSWPMLRTWSLVPLGLVSVWAFASTAWASDKFAAAASASTWIGASALLFVFAQTVRRWSSYRIVLAIAAGLLFVHVGYGVAYRLLDLPDLQADFQQNKAQILAARGWEPDSFAAQQFENRVMRGQTGGFATSPNTYAAALVLLGFATFGLAWQRWREKSEPNWAIVLALGLLPALWILWTTGSRAAMAGAVLGAVALAALWPLRRLLAQRRAVAFTAGVALVVVAVVVVVGIGLSTGTLPQDSLRFRWNYWLGGWGVFTDSPLLGVGFANFGDPYLLHRVGAAAEEIQDPHNLVIRFFTETGLIGGLLALAWLGLLAWELTRPSTREDDEVALPDDRPPGVPLLIGVILAGLVLHVIAGIDFSSDPGYVALELFRRALYGLLLVLGVLMGCIRSATDLRTSTLPAPAAVATVVAAVAVVLTHSMVDIVLFEPSMLMGFAMLAGATIGIKALPGGPASTRLPAAVLAGVLTLATAGYVVFYVAPTVIAERLAVAGDFYLRRGQPRPALQAYQDAQEWSPVSNSDYPRRALTAAYFAGASPETAEALALEAVRQNPQKVTHRTTLGQVYLHEFDPPRLEQAAEQYDAAVALNPNDVRLRLDYADVLERLGRHHAAAEQLEAALAQNERFDEREPERLTPEQVEALRQRIGRLREAP